jgi:hypothetical protein
MGEEASAASSRTELGRTALIAGDPATTAGGSATDDPPTLTRADAAAQLGGDPGATRFAVEGTLGQGATGEVWAARDRSLDRPLAIKVLRRDLMGDGPGREGFIHEARLTASLTHPNVLAVYDFDLTADGRPFIAMARSEGRTLGSALELSTREQRDPSAADANAVISIVIALCNAVAYAHHRGLVHQDIKPENVLLGDFGEVLLLDWGSAGRIGENGRVRDRLYGTPLYMSPEQARAEYADRVSDVYSLGATLFHALLLRLPIWSDEVEVFWERKRAGIIDPPTSEERSLVPPALLAIALRALAPEPALRYASVEELRRDLERYQAGQAVAAYREPPWLRLRRWYRAHVAVVWVAAVASLAVAAALGVAALQYAKELSAWRPVAIGAFPPAAVADLASHWVAREKANWGVPGFSDRAIDATAPIHLADGGVVLDPGEALIDLAWRDPVRGDLRVEWDYRALELGDNLNCFIGGSDRESGFTFHIGGFGVLDGCRLTRGPRFELLACGALPRTVEHGRTYHIRMERESRHLRLAVDGLVVIDYVDAENIGGDLGQRFGFDCIAHRRSWIGNLTVQRRLPAQRISPLEVGDALFEAGAWHDAELRYGEIREAYPGSETAQLAELRIATCAVKLGRSAEALAALQEFAKRNEGRTLAPVALVRASRVARDAGDAATVRRTLQELVRYRGDPLLPGVVFDQSGEFRSKLGSIPPDQLVATVTREQRELLDLKRDYGLDADMYDEFSEASCSVLFQHGFLHQILDLPHPSRYSVGLVLLEFGRIAEIPARCPHDPEAAAWALSAQGHLREVADDLQMPINYRLEALYHLGDLEAMRRLAPTHQMVTDLELYTGHFQEYLAAHPVDPYGADFGESPCVVALLATGRAEEVLRDYRHFHARGLALCALGRPAEAVPLPQWPWLTTQIAVTAAEQGDLPLAQRELAWLEGNRRSRVAVGAQIDWEDWIGSALIQGGLGDREAERATLQSAHAEAARETGSQRAWHLAGYALAALDDAGFLAQPYRLQADSFLLLARGLRADLAGDAAAAAADYRALLALPFWKRDLRDPLFYPLAWRVRAAGLTIPDQATTGYLGYLGR